MLNLTCGRIHWQIFKIIFQIIFLDFTSPCHLYSKPLLFIQSRLMNLLSLPPSFLFHLLNPCNILQPQLGNEENHDGLPQRRLVQWHLWKIQFPNSRKGSMRVRNGAWCLERRQWIRALLKASCLGWRWELGQREIYQPTIAS